MISRICPACLVCQNPSQLGKNTLRLILVYISLQNPYLTMNVPKKLSLISVCAGWAVLATATLSLELPAIAGNTRQSSPSMMGQTATKETGTIVEVAAANPSFTTLVAAIKAAGLVETLSGKGPFTVFAPTDKAFAALPKGTLETLLKPENKAKLQKILTYHVISGKITSKTIKSGDPKTVEGSALPIVVKGGKVMVGNAQVVAADVDASNGVIHVIDTVLLPPN